MLYTNILSLRKHNIINYVDMYRNTLEFLGIWEQTYNPDFKGGEFEPFKKEAGLSNFVLSPVFKL